MIPAQHDLGFSQKMYISIVTNFKKIYDSYEINNNGTLQSDLIYR